METRVHGELFCLAAQDGVESEQIRTLIWRLRKSLIAPTSQLLFFALRACRLGRAEKESWRNVPTLLELARREQVALSEEALSLALQCHPPATAIPSRVRIDGIADRPPPLRALARVLGVQLSETGERRMRLLLRSPVVADHARSLLQQLREEERIANPRIGDTAAARAGSSRVTLSSRDRRDSGTHDTASTILNGGVASLESGGAFDASAAITREQGETICRLLESIAHGSG
jgi:hypothetical protein